MCLHRLMSRNIGSDPQFDRTGFLNRCIAISVQTPRHRGAVESALEFVYALGNSPRLLLSAAYAFASLSAMVSVETGGSGIGLPLTPVTIPRSRVNVALFQIP